MQHGLRLESVRENSVVQYKADVPGRVVGQQNRLNLAHTHCKQFCQSLQKRSQQEIAMSEFPSETRLDDIIFEFEEAVRNEKAPEIQFFLNRFPQDRRENALKELLSIELFHRFNRREQVNASKYKPLGDEAFNFAREEIGRLESEQIISAFKQALKELDSDSGPKLIHKTLRQTPEPQRKKVWKKLVKHDVEHRIRIGSAVKPTDYRSLGPKPVEFAEQVISELRTAKTVVSKDSSPQPPSLEYGQDPEFIGRYQVQERLGAGTFGTVYLAKDNELDRQVAIKLPHAHFLINPKHKELYLREARSVAKLDHSNIVRIYDIGETETHPFFLVMQFISGDDLRTVLRHQKPDVKTTCRYILAICEALHHAHQSPIYHLDIKPENVLIDDSGKAYLVDFGLAFNEKDGSRLNQGKGGTPLYMSPEQHKGEGHYIDGRSDIFSVGVMFYEMLAGRRPFGSEAESIKCDVIPLEQIDPSIPESLDLICQKALQQQRSARYTTAGKMATRIKMFLENKTLSIPSNQLDAESKIRVPDLHPFDRDDARFFHQLLPGQRDIDGLPESIKFWKSRIESRQTSNPFKAGLLIGPSGCGKSSFVLAGLLPQLNERIRVVYLKATPDKTEASLLTALSAQFNQIAQNIENLSLASLMQEIRIRGDEHNRTVLIVVDQFEQWLNSNKGSQQAELTSALRQCDGTNLQCLLMVRDDFWLAVHRFMTEGLEVAINDRLNTKTFDLFSKKHARNVMTKFGQALGTLPSTSNEMTDDQKDFVQMAVDWLADCEHVICVKLSLFVNMMKNREWTLKSLDETGGLEGVGMNFLEASFVSNCPLPNRVHLPAIKGILKALLPDVKTDIKGRMRSSDELAFAAGYEDRPEDLATVLNILDTDTKLITPTDPEGRSVTDGTPLNTSDARYYQLTHDYLVQPIREWLTRQQKETLEGQTQLKLEETSALWKHTQQNRMLPGPLDSFNIYRLTDRKRWNDIQKKMMASATKVHSIRALAAIFLVAAAFLLWNQISKSFAKEKLQTTINEIDQTMKRGEEIFCRTANRRILKCTGRDREIRRQSKQAGFASGTIALAS